MAFNIWFYAFFMIYFVWLLTLYKLWLKKFITRLKNRTMYLHYVVLDTGDYGEQVFKAGEPNTLPGLPGEFTYVKDAVRDGVIYYNSKEAEPVRVERSEKDYKYFCFSKEFETTNRFDVLRQLMIMMAENKILLFIIIAIIVTAAAGIINIFMAYNWHNDILTAVQGMNNSIPRQP